jgi:hypothetical protein
MTTGHPLPSQGQPSRRRSGRPPLPPAHERDREERHVAERLGEAFPHWVVLWGAWSRQYWGYPRFRGPRGTIIHSAGPGDLAAQMRHVQAMATGAGR